MSAGLCYNMMVTDKKQRSFGMNNELSACTDDSVILETERLIIRELNLSDISKLRELVASCPEGIEESLSALKPDEYEEYLTGYIKYQYGFYGYGDWAVCLKDSTFIGLFGVKNGDESETAELGYALLPAYRHKGYAFEACSAIISYALDDIGFKRIEAYIAPDNEESLKLAARLKDLTVKREISTR